MVTVTQTKEVKARKQYECRKCGGTIQKGELYVSGYIQEIDEESGNPTTPIYPRKYCRSCKKI